MNPIKPEFLRDTVTALPSNATRYSEGNAAFVSQEGHQGSSSHTNHSTSSSHQAISTHHSNQQVITHSGHQVVSAHPGQQEVTTYPDHQEVSTHTSHQEVITHTGHQEVSTHPTRQQVPTLPVHQELNALKEPPKGTHQHDNRKILQIVVKSGEISASLYTNFSSYTVNDLRPDIEDPAINNAGLYVVVLHQATGMPLCRPFNFQPWADFHLLKPFIRSLQPGRIIIFVLRKDLAYGLPQEARTLLQQKGSVAAGFVGPGMAWAWVWVNGGSTLAEAVTFPRRRKMAPRHLINLYIPLDEPDVAARGTLGFTQNIL
ncbi:uncharacterized protein LOC122255057 [Penaeus japonicus]|uniref:uncharacterized protein LOC122255057 n=1 Tax=Penaeus japonicus TaxID=27405 RepID=UPI001C7110B4|nr:uncharacterized protein LOC122255057 [Penaeus japonicus]